MNPEIGRASAEETKAEIQEAIKGADMIFIAAGMGGGTGTGAAPVVAEMAKELGILTVAVVTKPFPFEGPKRMRVAEAGIAELSKYVDSLITIPNGKLLTHFDRDVTLLNAFKASNDVLHGAVQGISDLITSPGMVNVDFADVKTVMSEMGMAMMGTGIGRGDDRAAVATELAINSPLLEDIDMHGAKGILVNITAGMDLTLGETQEIGDMVNEYTSDNSTVVIGTAIDMDMDGEIRVTVVATGINGNNKVKLVENKPVEKLEISPSYINARVTNNTRSTASIQKPEHLDDTVITAEKDPMMSDDYLDIPAFLRNQAD
jgi:cell division protein FtsZ